MKDGSMAAIQVNGSREQSTRAKHAIGRGRRRGGQQDRASFCRGWQGGSRRKKVKSRCQVGSADPKMHRSVLFVELSGASGACISYDVIYRRGEKNAPQNGGLPFRFGLIRESRPARSATSRNCTFPQQPVAPWQLQPSVTISRKTDYDQFGGREGSILS